VNATAAHNDVVDMNAAVVHDTTDTASLAVEQQDELTTLIYDPAVYIHMTNAPQLLDLKTVEQFDVPAFQKKILNLFKVCRTMQGMMTTSGTHNNDPFNYIFAAMKGVPGLTALAVYYFWIRCEQNEGIDNHFAPFLDPALKGSTVHIANDADLDNESVGTAGNCAKKHKVGDALTILAEQSATMVRYMEEAKTDREASLLESKRKTKFYARLEVANALGNKAMLETLMKEANNMD
jgi:hypothetical protein